MVLLDMQDISRKREKIQKVISPPGLEFRGSTGGTQSHTCTHHVETEAVDPETLCVYCGALHRRCLLGLDVDGQFSTPLVSRLLKIIHSMVVIL